MAVGRPRDAGFATLSTCSSSPHLLCLVCPPQHDDAVNTMQNRVVRTVTDGYKNKNGELGARRATVTLHRQHWTLTVSATMCILAWEEDEATGRKGDNRLCPNSPPAKTEHSGLEHV